MKKALTIVAAMALALSMAGCNANKQQTEQPTDQAQQTASTPASEQAQTPQAEQTETTINWTGVTTADAAAKGAGFDQFAVMDQIKIGDIQFQNPAFDYAEGVAQAKYETGAAALFVRKAQGNHTAPLTDRDKTEFAQKWTKSVEGLDVTFYGPEKDAATVITWTDATQDFGVTIQGLGGEELTMNPDDVAAVVKGIKDAAAKAAGQAQQSQGTSQGSSSASSSSSTSSNYISADDAKSIAVATAGVGIPEIVSAELKVGGDAPHYEVTLVQGEVTHVVEIDAITGDVWSDEAYNGGASRTSYIGEDAAEDIAIATAGVGLPEQLTIDLLEDGDGPHYEVVLVQGTESHIIEIDAITGDVWSDDVYDAGADDAGYLTADDAKSIAISTVGLGLPDSATAELVTGGDAPHYVVELDVDGETHVVEIDAVSGDVWSDDVL